MKLPKSLQVLGKEYTVKSVSRKQISKIWGVKNEEPIGMYHTFSQILYVYNGLPLDLSLETLLHEMTHAISCELSLGLTEIQVNSLSVGIYSALKRNPNTWKLMWRKQ